MPDQLETALASGLRKLGMDPVQSPFDVYLGYIRLLFEWNHSYNLVASATPLEILNRHLLDALSILPFIQGKHCLDVGTGAGLPGFILALSDPNCHWTLLDARSKRIRFLRQLLLTFQIDNVELVHQRVEHFSTNMVFSTITSRAFASLPIFYHNCHVYLAPKGRLVAMKGRDIACEYRSLPVDVDVMIHKAPVLENRYHTVVELIPD